MTVKKRLSLERALDVAADLATTRPSVSVADIAAESHCSTATLYQCFTSKERLLLQAFEHGRTLWRAPAIRLDTDEDAFAGLVDYLHRRAEYLGSDRLRGLIGILLTQRDALAQSKRRNFADLDEMPSLIEATERAMRAGHLHAADASAVAYGVQAAVSYEPLMLGLLLGKAVNVPRLIRTVLTPHLTPAGATLLETLLGPVGEPDPISTLLGSHAERAGAAAPTAAAAAITGR